MGKPGISIKQCVLFHNHHIFASYRKTGEPPLENGLIPYLGCALQFGANPLEFLRANQRKHGHVFTCKLMGNYVHFITNPLSYQKVLCHGKYFDWKKFHFTTSAKVTAFAFIQLSAYFLLFNVSVYLVILSYLDLEMLKSYPYVENFRHIIKLDITIWY